ncbi:MAG: methyltransferase domain-containing protein [Candidatus Aenigmarchaeota archaeon]|nr:methyltransferase domain-containing protein [Candidatus Aenigmarchaeota archaeon]
MDNFSHRETCRVCGGRKLYRFLNLGKMALANAFVKNSYQEDEKFPLEVYFCMDCYLVQLVDIVNPKILFNNYAYSTSASKPLEEHFRKMGEDLVNKFVNSVSSLVIEIGSNDGALLYAINNRCKTLGIEPADNLAKVSVSRGIETIPEFFSERLAAEIIKKYGNAKIVIANNVVAHIDDLRGLFNGVKALVGKEGVFVFEVHWVGNLIGDGGFDQIYHEHLSYFSLHALSTIVKSVGLDIFDVEKVPIHGESLRVFVSAGREQSEAVLGQITLEKELGLDKIETYMKFADRVEKNKKALVELLLSLKGDGKTIIGYGAPAKGSTLLNYCGIDGKILDFVTDSTPMKQGLYTPGTHIKILPPDSLYKSHIDYALLLSWNYAAVIIEKERKFRKSGGKFIIPVPDVRIV